MKRRSFLGLFGAAVATPFLPAGAATRVGPQIKVMAAAHARKYPFVSVTGISNRIGVTIKEAEAILVDLSRKGMVGPVNTCATGPISASSRVFRPVIPMVRHAKAQRQKTPKQSSGTSHMQTDHKAWLRHLHQLCRALGMVVQPRALQALA